MDPDQALSDLQKHMKRIEKLVDMEECDELELKEVANRAVDLWNGLDRWMREAGALPRDWSRHR